MSSLSGLVASVLFILLTVDDVISKSEERALAKGRIKAFDDVLRMYGENINSGKNLKYAIEEAKRLARNPQYYAEFANYYVEILELIESTGEPRVIQQENDRLNVIITSASNQPGAAGEIDYAVVRRNILGAFIDSAAEYVMHGMFPESDDDFDEL